MAEDQQNGPGNTQLQRWTEDGVSAALAAAGGLMQMYPQTAHLGLMGLAVQVAGPFAARQVGAAVSAIQAFVAGRSEERARETADELWERLEEEGLTENADRLKDLWTRAIPIIAEDETKAKRDLIRELMVKTAGRDDLETALYEAGVATRLIGDLSGSAAMLLVWLFRDAKQLLPDVGPAVVIDDQGEYRGIDRQTLWPDVEELKKPLLIDIVQKDNKFYIYLNVRGRWLMKQVGNRDLD